MKYAEIRSMDISNGEGIGISIFVQGCPIHCKNCFNKETWDFNGGYEWNQEAKDKLFSLLNRSYIRRISILGGEPLCKENCKDVLELVKEIKTRQPNKKIWVYSGYTLEQLRQRTDEVKQIFTLIDFLVDSPYIDEKRDLSLSFRGSSNQRIIDIKKMNEN